jgi:hypothetical protein
MNRRKQLTWLVVLSALSALAQYIIQGAMASGIDATEFHPVFWIADYGLWGLRAIVEATVIVYLFQTQANTTAQRIGLAALEFTLIALIAATLGPALRAVGYGATMLASLGEPWFTLWTFGVASYTPLMMGAAGFAYKVQPHDAPVTSMDAPPITTDAARMSPAARRARLAETRRTMPDATHAMLAQALGVSATTVARDVAMLDTADVPGTTGGRNGRQR